MTGDDLRAAIRAAPASSEPRRVYADWLIHQGDPRGEWIALHDSTSDEAELKRRALWQRHGDAWRAADGTSVTAESSSLDRFRYVHGILEDVRLEEQRLLELAPILANHPIRTLSVFNIRSLESIAALPVLATVDHLDLGYGLETASEDAMVAVLEATPRLRSLAVSPHEDLDFIWDALARYSRLHELEELHISEVRIMRDRARWLGGALPALRALRWNAGLTDGTLETLVQHASFTLDKLYLSDRDGLHGRKRLLSGQVLSSVLQSAFTKDLHVLSVFGCNGYLLDEAVTKLPCAANLTALDLGSLESSSVVQALAHVAMPKLTWLSVRHDLVDDDCLAALTFPTLTTLRLEKNHLHGERVEALLEALPNLERLSIGDNTLGDQGVQSIAHSEHIAKLRHLEISSTRCSSDAVGALIEGGKLTELRSLELACNEDIKRKAIQVLATGPFDKLAHLSLSYISKTEIASLFAEAWLPSEQRGEDNYQRALNLDGTAVPHPRKAKKKKT